MSVITTTDLGLAAYLKFRGLPIKHVDRSNPRQVSLTFEDELNLGQQLQLEYMNSDFMRYNAEFRAIIRLIHGN